MFSFDPLTLSPALWAKKTNTGCYPHLGIIFGSSENIIYIYSYDSSALKVTWFIDSSSSTPSYSWTYGFSGNIKTEYVAIAHKAIDS